MKLKAELQHTVMDGLTALLHVFKVFTLVGSKLLNNTVQ